MVGKSANPAELDSTVSLRASGYGPNHTPKKNF
jgi:hypothetical protein